MLGCGSSSHKTAQNTQLEGLPPASAATTRCPSGKTLIRGHFHFYGCVPSREARVLFVCYEAGHELADILERVFRDLQPGALQHLFEGAASESIATLKRTKLELVESHESASSELLAVERHRRELVAYLAEVRRVHVDQSFGHWYKALLARDGGCRSKS